jgi:hypothetical protein
MVGLESEEAIMKVGKYIPDTTAPRLREATLDMNTNILELSFD